jgi:hypothetical protein
MQYECCSGKMPFEAQNEGALIRKIIRGAYQPVNAPVSPALVQLVDMMMTFDHRRRPDTTTLLNHTVVKMRVSIRCCCAGRTCCRNGAHATPQPYIAMCCSFDLQTLLTFGLCQAIQTPGMQLQPSKQ